jgi:uncharacterized cupin superfamily protein
MIVKNSEAPIESRTSDGWGTVHTQRFGDAGGITQFGASLQTLEPGARSSLKHWHEATDEMLFVVSGEVTVTENDVDSVLRAGDAASWPAGAAVAHTVSNRSNAPCSFFVVGTRASTDVTHYEEIGQTMHTDGVTWKLVDASGKLLRAGRADENPWASE